MPDHAMSGNPPTEVDWIVVGAGSAGTVVASRLSEDPELRIAVLEVGGPNDGPEIRTPARASELPAGASALAATTVPQAAAGGREVPLVTGTGLGGGSSINGMGWFHGQAEDYDRWVGLGATGWTAEAMHAVLRDLEDHELGASAFHGAGGPMAVSTPSHVPGITSAFVRTADALGWPILDDVNGGARVGVGLAQSTIRDGQRYSVVDGYLADAATRTNLSIHLATRADRVVFDGARAAAIEWTRTAHDPGSTGTTVARRGIVLAAGAIQTPQLLMRSGIGPGEHLRALGIEPQADLPAVGGNLHDHPAVPVPITLKAPQDDQLSPHADDLYRLIRRGPLSTFAQAVALLPASTPITAATTPELVIGYALIGAAAGLPAADGPDGFLQAGLLDPKSRGTIRLTSPEPGTAALIDPQYLTHPDDRPRLRDRPAGPARPTAPRRPAADRRAPQHRPPRQHRHARRRCAARQRCRPRRLHRPDARDLLPPRRHGPHRPSGRGGRGRGPRRARDRPPLGRGRLGHPPDHAGPAPRDRPGSRGAPQPRSASPPTPAPVTVETQPHEHVKRRRIRWISKVDERW